MQNNKKNTFTIVGGPCAVESKQQVENTYKAIYNYVDVFRAGVWKGRTSPNCYSGYGEGALAWLRKLQSTYSKPVAVEVGTVKHVELALRHNINIVWIGARTTVNSFYVHEIAECLRGTDAEVWIKNPIYPDLNLWYGAINRMSQVGLKSIKAIHRGFFSESEFKYRNSPRWELVNSFREKLPNIAVFCDPSHISGESRIVESVSRKAIAENMSGLMIEVHNKPNNALSDARQQMTPFQFIEMLKKIM